jgi:hypothetical protein
MLAYDTNKNEGTNLGVLLFICGGGGGSILETDLLLLLRLRAVLVQKLEQLRGCVLVRSV